MPAGQDGSQLAAFAAGANLSSAVYCGGQVLYNLQLPAASWTASALTFLGSVDGVNFYPLNVADTGAEAVYTLTTTGTGGKTYAVNPNYFAGLRAFKISSTIAQANAVSVVAGLRDTA